MACGCNKNTNNVVNMTALMQSREIEPPGIKLPDFVLVTFLPESGAPVGPATGIQYSLMFRNEVWWVHQDDVAVRPNWWREVVAEPA